MSDYQTVTVKAIDPAKKTVTIEVEEHPDSRALASLFDAVADLGGDFDDLFA